MPRPVHHPSTLVQKVGVLLINLGTPDAPEARAVRRYLAEFLSDPRVIEIPAIAWKPILHGIVLRFRPHRSAEAYNQIWTNEGSPLAVIAKRQAHALREQKRPLLQVERPRSLHPPIKPDPPPKGPPFPLLVLPLFPFSFYPFV